MEKGHTIHAAFLDAAKAFDRVDHSTLLSLLSDVGIRGIPLKWFWSYLSSRNIHTRVAGSLSERLPITSGVPQGSVLGPLLFLVYFKDIPASTEASSALFADDTLLYEQTCRPGHCQLSTYLEQFHLWTVKANVNINSSKSADLSIGPGEPTCGCAYEGTVFQKFIITTILE